MASASASITSTPARRNRSIVIRRSRSSVCATLARTTSSALSGLWSRIASSSLSGSVDELSSLRTPSDPAKALDAIASSLTELFSPKVIGERVSGMLAHYDFVDDRALAYFTARPPQAERDVVFALDHVRRHATTLETQRAVVEALIFKTGVLWAQLDALWHGYVTGQLPPGAT